MAVHEQGAGMPVVFLHGFPELAYSWRYQLPAFAGAGFRAIAPDLRGYGASSVPPNITDYTMSNLIADVHGLLDALDIETATFVGHDWGALILWHMAMRAPTRIDRLAVLNIPHYPRSPVDPIAIMRAKLGDDFYIVNFQDSDEADRAFATDPGHLFDVLMRKNQTTRKEFEQLPAAKQSLSLLRTFEREEGRGEPLLSVEERDVFVRAFAQNGFTGPINWYRNWTENWQALDGVDQAVSIPTLFIGAVDDVIIAPEHIDAMKPLVTDLTVHMIDHCGHWTQQEHPDEVNRVILDWLR